MTDTKKVSVLDVEDHHLTPGMKQYQDVKKVHPDCLVMLRMGDFYEMFYEDAVTASRELEITLTQDNHTTLGYVFAPLYSKAHVKVYEIVSNETPVFNPDDIIEGLWLYPQEVLERFKKGENMKITLPRLITLFYIPDVF